MLYPVSRREQKLQKNSHKKISYKFTQAPFDWERDTHRQRSTTDPRHTERRRERERETGIWELIHCCCTCWSGGKRNQGEKEQEELVVEARRTRARAKNKSRLFLSNGIVGIRLGEACLLLRSLSQEQGEQLDPCAMRLAHSVFQLALVGLHQAAGAAVAMDAQQLTTALLLLLLLLPPLHGAQLQLRDCGNLCRVVRELGSPSRFFGGFSGASLLGGCQCGGAELAHLLWSQVVPSFAAHLLELSVRWTCRVRETRSCFAPQSPSSASHCTFVGIAATPALRFPLRALPWLHQERWDQSEC